MTFDDAMAKVGTYLKNNDLSNSDNNDRFFYTILNELRLEYAPTVEMTKKQYEISVSSRDNAVNRVDKVGLLEFMSAYALLDLEIDHLRLMQAWLHPETIKIIDE